MTTYDWSDLTNEKVTTLYLYGKESMPEHFYDRFRTLAEINALPTVMVEGVPTKVLTIQVDMETYMSTGPGRYAHASKAPAVENFFNSSMISTLSLADGQYTKADLVNLYAVHFQTNGMTSENAITEAKRQFNISLDQSVTDIESGDYAKRTYIWNSGAFTISDDAVFVVDSGIPLRIEDMAIWAYDDNFDFITDNTLHQIGNEYLLRPQIDPYKLGIRLDFDFVNKESVATYEQLHNGNHFNYSANTADYALAQAENDWLSANPLPAMLGVVEGLETAGIVLKTSRLFNLVNATFHLFQRGNSTAERVAADPLVIDLDRDGLELIGIPPGVVFDLSGDSTEDLIGWAGPNEGLLAFDRNSNGAIDNSGELYGNLTQTGFEVLAADEAYYATNGVGVEDGIIDANDVDLWANLRVWKDANSNGAVDSGELMTMAQAGITAIDIRGNELVPDGRWISNNEIIESGTVTYDDNETGRIYEVFFEMRLADAVANAEGLYFGSDAELLALPQSRGYGALPSLQDAMAADEDLKDKVEAFAEGAVNGSVSLRTKIEAILFQWAGVENEGTPGTPGYTAQKLAFLEVMFDTEVTGVVGAQRQPIFTQAFENAYNVFATRLLVQGPLAALFPNAHYDAFDDMLTLGSDFEQVLDALDGVAGLHNVHALQALRTVLLWNLEGLGATAQEIRTEINERMVELVASAEDLTYGLAERIANLHIDNVIEAQANPITYLSDTYGTAFNDMIIGLDGNSPHNNSFGDQIYTDAGDDYVIGGGGNDNITNVTPENDQRNGSDILLGGEGNDSITTYHSDGNYVSGGAGNDSLYVNSNRNVVIGGEGDDYLAVSGDENTVAGGEGNDQLYQGSLYYAIRDSVIDLGGGQDYAVSLDLRNSLLLMGDGDDYTSLSWPGRVNLSENSLLDGGEGNDALWAFVMDSTISGGEGNDTIQADAYVAYDFMVDGGEGNDLIRLNVDSVLTPATDQRVYGGDGDDTIAAVISNTTDLIIDGGAGDDDITIGWQTSNYTVAIVDEEGDDLYTLGQTTSGVKHVTITDGDGIGEIRDFDYAASISGEVYNLLSGVIAYVSANRWESGDYQFAMSGDDLVITYDNDPDRTITVTDFENGDLGITLASAIITGTGGNDTLAGTGNADSMMGLSGDDSIAGLDGDDTIEGGAGADTVDGGNGIDTASYAASGAGVNVNLGTGIHSGGDAAGDSLSGIENILGSAYVDILAGDAGANVLAGGDGVDYLSGGAGADTLDGQNGYDYADYQTSPAGVSVNAAGSLNFYGDAAGDVLMNIEGVYGSVNYADTIYGTSAANYFIGFGGNDALYGGSGNDTLDGGSGSDTLDGGADSDYADYRYSTAGVNVNLATNTHSGGYAAGDSLAGIENVYGSVGYNDAITGDAGANVIYGYGGDDTITGGGGNDMLIGGDGADVFVYAVAASGNDTISGFEGGGVAGGDVIRFHSATGLTSFSGVQAVTSYNAGASTAMIDLGSGDNITITGITSAFVSGDFAFV